MSEHLHVMLGKNLAGTTVTIKGLQGRPELNGTAGTLIDWHTETHRWMVKTTSGESVRMRDTNIVFAPGAKQKTAIKWAIGLLHDRDARIEYAKDLFMEADSNGVCFRASALSVVRVSHCGGGCTPRSQATTSWTSMRRSI